MRWALFTVAVLLAVGLCAPGAVAAVPDHDDSVFDHENETDANETSSGFGQQVSSFVQSTASETSGAVDQGMWEARIAENGSAADVEDRAETLNERLSELRAERDRLREARENGSIDHLEFASRMAEVTGQLDAISSAANASADVAEEMGVETDAFEEIDDAAREDRASVADVPDVAEGDPANASNGSAADNRSDDTPADDNRVDDDTPAENGSSPGENLGVDDDGSDQGNASDASGDGNASDASGDGNASDASGDGDDSDASGDDGRGDGNDGNGSDVPLDDGSADDPTSNAAGNATTDGSGGIGPGVDGVSRTDRKTVTDDGIAGEADG